MDFSDAQARFKLLRQRFWPLDEIRNWFGVDLSEGPRGLLAQYKTWVEQQPSVKTAPEAGEKQIERNRFELFLQKRELLGARASAARWGMDEKSFTHVLQAALDKDYVSEAEQKGEFRGVYRAALISDFYKRLPGLAHTTFASYSGFVRRVHREIQSVLDVTVTPLFDPTSKVVGEDPPDFAYGFDSITNDPMESTSRSGWRPTNRSSCVQIHARGSLTLSSKTY